MLQLHLTKCNFWFEMNKNSSSLTRTPAAHDVGLDMPRRSHKRFVHYGNAEFIGFGGIYGNVYRK